MSSSFNSAVNLPAHAGWRAARPSLDDCDFPRRRYFLDIPVLLLSVGILTWIAPTDSMLAVASFVGGIVGFYTLWDVIVRRAPLRFSRFFCIAYVTGYGFGTLNTWLTLPRGDMELAEYLGRDTAVVAQGMAAVLISSGVLYAWGELYEKPIFGSRYKITLDNRALMLTIAGSIGLLVAYATGMLGYMGAGEIQGGGSSSIVGSLIIWLYPALFAFTCLAFLDRPKSGVKWLLGGLVLLQFFMIVPTGRRALLYCMLLAAIASRFSSFQPKWSTAKKAVVFAVLAGATAVGAVAFYYLRFAAYGTHHKLSLAERASLAVDLYENKESGKLNQDLQSNLQRRTFVLGYLSDLLNASEQMQPAMGRDAWHEFQVMIPGALWENKASILSYQEEGIANMQFNFAYSDESNSTLTAGALDFGIWGMILYPILLAQIYRISAGFLRNRLPATVSVFVILALFFDAILTENGLGGHMVSVRNTLIYSVVFWLFFKIPNFGLRRVYSLREAEQ